MSSRGISGTAYAITVASGNADWPPGGSAGTVQFLGNSWVVRDSHGGAPLGPPLPMGFLTDEARLRVPRYAIASVSVERKLPGDLYGKVSYMDRDGGRGFAFVNPAPLPGPLPGGGFYDLRNFRRDRYDALELSVRKTFGQFEWCKGDRRISSGFAPHKAVLFRNARTFRHYVSTGSSCRSTSSKIPAKTHAQL